MGKKILVIIILMLGLILNPLLVVAEENVSSTPSLPSAGTNSAEIDAINKQIAEKNAKIKELEATMGKYQKNIEQKQTEAASLNNQLSILDNHLAQTQTDIEATEEKIKEARLEIEALDLSIEDKEKVIERQKQLIIKMVQTINADKQKGYIEILLTNTSFSDFYNQVEYLTSLYTDLGSTVKILRLAKEDLQKKQTQVQNRKQLYDKLKQDLLDKKAQLDDQSVTKQNLLLQTRSSEMRYKTLLAELKKQSQAIENEVRSYEDQVRKKLAEQSRFQNLSSKDFAWPVPSRVITATFHDPDYPFRKVMEHSGMDIRASQGTPLRAANSGYKEKEKKCSTASCYSYVLIIHTGNLSTLYGHMSSISVSEDQFINKGDIIGYTGGTPGMVGSGPFVTGPHLHFEVRLNGIPVNPANYLP